MRERSLGGRAVILSMLVVIGATSAVLQTQAASAGTEWLPQVKVRPLKSSDLDQPPFVLQVRQKMMPSAPPVFPPPQDTSPDLERLQQLNTPRTGINTIAPEPPPAGARSADRIVAVVDGIDGGVPFVQSVDELPRFDHWDRPLVVTANAPESFPVTLFALVKKDGRVGRVYSPLGLVGGARTAAEHQLGHGVLEHVALSSRFNPARRAGEPVDCWVAVVVAPKVVVADSSLKVKVTPQIISATELQRIPVDNIMQAPVFPPLGHQTRDEADRLRLLNTQKQGTLTIAPYPSPVLEGGELVFRGTRSGDTTFQLNGKPVIPALTRPDSVGPGPRPTVKRERTVPKPH